MNAAFYLDNGNHQNVDYSDPYRGNPGIGGTQFMIWLISCLLSERYKDINVFLFAQITEKMPEYMQCKRAVDVEDALRQAAEMGLDVFICRGPALKESFYKALEDVKIKTIIWSHNYECHMDIKRMSGCQYVKRNICVGREQYERLRDTAVYKKSMYIFNTINFSQYNAVKRENVNFKSICYLGSLNKQKGFGELAKAWPEIEKKVPDAELIVLGGGKLYDKNAKLGKYGLAAESFEKSFIGYLIDESGKIKPNVHFMGVVGGYEKLEIMSRAGVGIVNPSGRGETFCIGAIEFEALEIPVVSAKKYALLDTVQNGKTGRLFKTEKQFVDYAAELMNDTELNMEMGRQGRVWANEKFGLDTVLRQWHDMLFDVYNDKPTAVDYTCHNPGNNFKWLRELNRRIKKVLPFLPSMIWYEDIPRTMIHFIRDRRSF